MGAGIIGFSRYFVELINEHEKSVEFSSAVGIGAFHVCTSFLLLDIFNVYVGEIWILQGARFWRLFSANGG